MRIRCEREPFLAAFQTAATVAPSRSPKAILQNVKMVARPEITTLMATDMEVGIRIEVSGIDVETPGEIVLPVGRVGSILRESSDSHLRIEVNEKGCVIRGDRSEFKLPLVNPDEFPEIAAFQAEKYYVVQAKLLRELIRRTVFATDLDSSRYALGGVLLEVEGDKLTGVGTDGRRLAKMEGPVQTVGGSPSSEGMTIVPTRSMQLIERALSDADGEVFIATRSNDVLVKSPRVTIYSRLVEGRFPRWRDVIPERPDAARIELPVGPALSAVRQAAVVVSDETRGVEFTFRDGSLMLAAATAGQGEAHVEFPISYAGEEVRVSLDHRYVSDFLRVLDSDKTFTIEVAGAESAALMRTDDGFAYVVMPMAKQR